MNSNHAKHGSSYHFPPFFFVPFHSNCRDLQGADAHPGGLIKSIVSSLHDATHTIDDWFDNAVGGDGAF
jgi:hypothetical protein